jgi:hypothetical protein
MTRCNLSVFMILALALLLGLPHAARAAESYDNCTGFITSIPATINSQGTWCLKQDLATAITSGNAIDIQANNVTLDCNNFKLGGLAAGLATTAIGVHNFDRFNATVRHCNIRGFYAGLYFGATTGSSSGGHLVEDNRFDGNTSIGLVVKGDGSVIQRNRVFDTGGATAGGDANGIGSSGSVDILDNRVSGVVATSGSNGWAYGINAQNNSGGGIDGNRVRGLVPDGPGFEFGISAQGSQVALHANELVGSGITGGKGVDCTDSSSGAKDNFINHFATPINNCTDGGGNVVVP